MAVFNAQDESFELIEVLGQPALFSCMRIRRASVPQGLFQYEVRYDDDGRGEPVQIALGIMVNHWGTILTRKPIELPENGYLDIDPEKDWNYGSGESMTPEAFASAEPPAKAEEVIVGTLRYNHTGEIMTYTDGSIFLQAYQEALHEVGINGVSAFAADENDLDLRYQLHTALSNEFGDEAGSKEDFIQAISSPDMNKRVNCGYTIIDSIRTGNTTELVLGESKTAPCRFVVWKCTDGTDYALGFYSNDKPDARKRMYERAEDERTGIPKKPKEKPHER